MKTKLVFITSVLFVLLGLLMISCQKTLIVSYTPVSSEKMDIDPVINFYIENTGSMDGYMCGGSEYKDAIYSYASSLGAYAKKMQLNYINTEIIPYNGNLQSFIGELTPDKLNKTGGNTSYSDIADMLNKVTAKAKGNAISVFVTDCILALPNGATKDYYVNRQIEIKNIFAKYLYRDKKLSVEIFRLESNFVGKYYPGAIRINGKRPYYMFVIGNKNILSKLNKKVPFSDIQHGINNYFAYTNDNPMKFEITNKFGIGTPKSVVLKTPSRDGKYKLYAKVDMLETLLNDEVLEQIDNYKINNNFCKIESVVNAGVPDYTHLLVLSLDEKVRNSVIKISFIRPVVPSWLDDANGDGTFNIKKTMGVKYIIGGISDAYKNSSHANFNFIITNK